MLSFAPAESVILRTRSIQSLYYLHLSNSSYLAALGLVLLLYEFFEFYGIF